MSTVDKRELLDMLLAVIADEIAVLLAAAEATHASATHEESAPENDKDTRAIEASYLARGQAARVEDMQETATRLRFMDITSRESIGLGALVEVEVDGEPATYFLVPAGGGRKLQVGDREIVVLTSSSPVGRALAGKQAGDDFELRIAKHLREYEVVSVD